MLYFATDYKAKDAELHSSRLIDAQKSLHVASQWQHFYLFSPDIRVHIFCKGSHNCVHSILIVTTRQTRVKAVEYLILVEESWIQFYLLIQ